MICFAFLCAGVRRWLWSMSRRFPFFSAASYIASHSASEIAIGFSQSTCLPWFSASIVIGAWYALATQTLTASMAGSAIIASAVSYTLPPKSAAIASARSRETSNTP